MDLRDGLEIRENLIIKWDYSFDEVKSICEANNIDFDCETTYCGTKYELKEITLYLEFANLGNIQAVIYFVKDSITEIYLNGNIKRLLCNNSGIGICPAFNE